MSLEKRNMLFNVVFILRVLFHVHSLLRSYTNCCQKIMFGFIMARLYCLWLWTQFCVARRWNYTLCNKHFYIWKHMLEAYNLLLTKCTHIHLTFQYSLFYLLLKISDLCKYEMNNGQNLLLCICWSSGFSSWL